MVTYILILLFVVLNIVEAFTDHYIQKASTYTDVEYTKFWHSWDAIYKVIVFSAIAFLVSENIFSILYTLVLALVIRWVVFELALNRLNNRKWYYVGTIGAIDIFFQKFKLPEFAMILTKLIVIMSLIVINFFNN